MSPRSAASTSGDPSRPADFQELLFLSPEQYAALVEARVAQGRDLSREQWQAVLDDLAERP